MLLLAWRQLQLDRLKTLLTACAIGAVVAVILVLQGFAQGQYEQLARAVLDRGADLIVTQSGITNFMTRSSVPQLARAEVEAVPGVLAAHPMTAVPVIYDKSGSRTPIYIFVTDGRGGPRKIVEGRDVTAERDIVVDRSLAAKYDIHIGDAFLISDFEFTVSGIASGSAAFFTPFAFISYDGMIDFFLDSELAPDISTFPLLSSLLVEVDDASDPSAVAREIESRVPSVDVFTPEGLAARDVAMGRGFLRPIIGLLAAVAYIIGLLVVGLIVYAEVTSRSRSFAVLKALGFPFGRLAQGVLLQTLLLLLIGLPIGAVLAGITAASIQWAAPLYRLAVFDPGTVAQTIAACVVFAGAGSLVPLRHIRRTDPMLAFEGQ